MPVYSFGENDVFRLKVFAKGSWQHLYQTTCQKLKGFAPCLFWDHGLFLANSWGLLPFPVPITTVGEFPSPGKKATTSRVAEASHLTCHPSHYSGLPQPGASVPPHVVV